MSSIVRRLGRAWSILASDQRLAAIAAAGLFVSMLLPWYVETVVFTRGSHVAHNSLTAFGSFSFVEAAVLLVAGGVLYLLFARAEDRAFHLPGGDGWVIMAAGAWAALLIFYRLLDTPATTRSGSGAVIDVGLKWGIFVALAAAIALGWAGSRVRAAHHPEPEIEIPQRRPRAPSPPPLPPASPFGPSARPSPAASSAARSPARPDGQMSLEDE